MMFCGDKMQFHFYIKINEHKEIHAWHNNAFEADEFYKEMHKTLKKGYWELKNFDSYMITFCYDEIANTVLDMSVTRYRRV